MEKLALVGYYGMNNFGDDLFGFVGINAAQEFWKKQNPFIVSAPILGVDANYSMSNERLASIYPSHSAAGKITRLANSVYAAFKADHYVYCGGSMFSEGSAGNRRYADKVASRKIAGIGVSVGPFANIQAERKTISLLEKMEYLALRDKRSFEFVKSLNLQIPVVLAADIAGLTPRYLNVSNADVLKNNTPNLVEKSKSIIGLTLCNYQSDDREQLKFCQDFVGSIKKIRKLRNIEVVVISLNSHKVAGDDLLSSCAAKMLSENEIEFKMYFHGVGGVKETLRQIAKLDAYVTARLHGAIAAYIYEIPFVIHTHHQKLVDFADDVLVPSKFRYGKNGVFDMNLLDLLFHHSTSENDLKNFSASAELNFLAAPWI